MNKKTLSLLTLILILTLILTACELPLPSSAAMVTEASETEPAPTEEETEAPTVEVTEEVTETPAATEEPTATEEVEETEEVEPTEETDLTASSQTYGPTDFPEDINPLTGWPVSDPDLLDLPPALISVSNFPASARPQAGLNTSPIIYEMTIGEGMTRFLAMFYGAFPSSVSGQTEGDLAGGGSGGSGEASAGSTSGGDTSGEGAANTASVGPIRSGRLPYEDIRSMYTGFLVMASAYSGIAQTLSDATTIYGSDSSDINSAMIGIDALYDIALGHAEGYPGSDFNLEGMMFSQDIPEGGQAAETVWVFYSSLNQIKWVYDEALGGYVRYDIKTDGSGEFVMATDRLTGDPILRENVVVIYALHEYYAPTLIDVYLTNMPKMKAVLFRDGQVFDIFWTTQYGDYEQETGLSRPMRFVDENGDPFALKNGRTWVEIVSTTSFHVESEISDYPFTPIKEAEGTGLWLVRYKGTY